jgi:phosphatidylserine/phosphatidylglycerophosphate/cardiolipin synthase-like enzyme
MDSGRPLIELVITAPEPYGALLAYRTRSRNTLGVLTQLIAKAKREVVLSAPYLQSGYGLSDGPLADALMAALKRGVNVDVASTSRGLQTLSIGRLRHGSIGTLRLFQHHINLEDDENLGSHAKFCVVDETWAYVGSANLTGPGLSKHFELGVLIEGDVARQVSDFWKYATEIGLFVRAS